MPKECSKSFTQFPCLYQEQCPLLSQTSARYMTTSCDLAELLEKCQQTLLIFLNRPIIIRTSMIAPPACPCISVVRSTLSSLFCDDIASCAISGTQQADRKVLQRTTKKTPLQMNYKNNTGREQIIQKQNMCYRVQREDTQDTISAVYRKKLDKKDFKEGEPKPRQSWYTFHPC